ncbi:MAG TPA: class I SAM-dependent methyltransferase [Polyangia bacterium]|jgi:predicted O-methyltransferase YrrM|nr:class I SAM-dependent methyltransferase [Polyangia bacterium]
MSDAPRVDPALPLAPPQAHETGLALLRERLGHIYQAISGTDLLRTQSLPYSALHLRARLDLALGYYERRMAAMIMWLHCSLEDANFTYDLTERNRRHLAHLVSVVVGCPAVQVSGYLRELQTDDALRAHYAREIPRYGRLAQLESRLQVGRRAGWYAVVRAIKPKVVIETGVERGHGAITLAAALLRNRAEGFPGRYYGTEINPAAGKLLSGVYAEVGEIIYGDSATTLAAFNQPIDVFVNDSDHSADYEAREYRIVDSKMSPGGVILSDNAHATDSLLDFAEATGRQYLFFREEPKDHWYPGAGIGFAFRPGSRSR